MRMAKGFRQVPIAGRRRSGIDNTAATAMPSPWQTTYAPLSSRLPRHEAGASLQPETGAPQSCEPSAPG